jgi:hypothetical protein
MARSVESNPLILLNLLMVDSVSDGITSKPEYAFYILEALRVCGGKASEDEVMDRVAGMMACVLTEKDRLNLYGDTVPRWRNQASHMLEGLIEEGYIARIGVTLNLIGKFQPN